MSEVFKFTDILHKELRTVFHSKTFNVLNKNCLFQQNKIFCSVNPSFYTFALFYKK